MKNTPHHLGHRDRIRKKFLNSLGEELSDYELLEILLFSANARKDTKAIAKKLLAKFGDISAIINAEVEMLKSVEGLGNAAVVQIKVISQIIKNIFKNNAKKRPVLNNWEAVLQYAKNLLQNLNHEVFYVLFLDKKYSLIEDELIATGENDHVQISNKKIVKKALILQASSVVLLHNHPSGMVYPSQSDIKTTDKIISALGELEIRVLDHLIISKNSHFSFKAEGLL